MNRQSVVPALQLSVRAGVTAAASMVIAQRLGLNVIQCLLTVAFVVDLSPAQTRELALRRFAGTALGAVMGAALAQLAPTNAISIGFGILAAMLLSYLLRLEAAARLAAYTCGAVMFRSAGAPWAHAGQVLIETSLAIALATLTSFVPKVMAADPDQPQG